MKDCNRVGLHILRCDAPTLRELRGLLPAWSWRAVRHGMGWQYRGVRGSEQVTIQREAHLCGPLDDDYVAVWMADDGESRMRWWLWVDRRLGRDDE